MIWYHPAAVAVGPSRLFGPFDFDDGGSRRIHVNQWKALDAECVRQRIEPPPCLGSRRRTRAKKHKTCAFVENDEDK